MAAFLVLMTHTAQAEIRDALPPDSGVFSAPLNIGPNTQQKVGSLIIGTNGGSSKFCLNAAGSSDILGNCVSDWSQISTTKYVAINAASLPNFDAQDSPIATIPSNYTGQAGYSDITAATKDQHVTAAITSSDVNICVRDYNDQGAGYCFGQGNSCLANSDCGTGQSDNFIGTAVYGVGNSNSSNFAGYFGGTVYVRAPSTSLFSGNDRGRICLGSFEPPYSQVNGGTDGCISSWNELTASPPPYVQLQAVNPPVSQTYGAVIAGSSTFGTAVVGSTAGMTLQMTCGNGICDAGENATSCAVDCSGISTPTNFTPQVNIASTFFNLRVDLSITAAAQQPSTVKILIVRSLNVPPVFRPANGVDYANGTDLGNSTFVVANATTTSGATISNLTDILPNRGTYYYQAYQANAYPKYSAPTAAVAITPYEMGAIISPSNKGVLISTPDGITCSNSVTNCRAWYNGGTTLVVTLDAIQSGYRLDHWTGNCDQVNGLNCTVLMNSDKSVWAHLTTGSGGGGGGGRLIE